MKKLKKLKRQLFGKTFNIWDIILLLSVIPYFYLIFVGIEFTSGFGGIYYKILAPALTFATVIKYLVGYVRQKQKK